MMETRPAALVIEEVPITAIGKIRTGVEIQSVGPIAAKMTDGWMIAGPLAMCCDDVEGIISACSVVIDGKPYVTTQLDVSHRCQSLHVASSFALPVEDFARLLDRLKAVLDLARLEASAGDRRG